MTRLHPIMEQFFDLAAAGEPTERELATWAGVGRTNFRAWRGGASPRLKVLSKALEGLGFALVIVPIEDVEDD
tara:strand:- start:181 stop:399 length:219 start_codon:yes stop_codon:yes gene_type:complete